MSRADEVRAEEALAGVTAMFERGWHPLDMPWQTKFPPPEGRTGRTGADYTLAEIAAIEWQYHSIGARMADGVIGVDLDLYKEGTIERYAEVVKRCGKLPKTLMATARTDHSGIRFFRVPAGIRFKGAPIEGVEIIQRHHRYAMVSGWNPKAGAEYQLIDEQSGEVVPLESIWDTSELADLPWAWVEEWRVDGPEGVHAERAATDEEYERFCDAHQGRARMAGLNGLRTKLADVLVGGRHDALIEVGCWAMREARAGWYPADEAVGVLHEWWERSMKRTGDVDRLDAVNPEFFDAILWAVAAAEAEGDARIADLVAEAAPAAEAPTQLEEGVPVDMTPAEYLASRMLTPAQLAARPRPTYLIDKHIPDGTNVFIVGPSGVGKSFLALDWALKVATGGGTWGDGYDVRGGRVLYVAAEGVGGISKRIEAWQKYYRVAEDPAILVLDVPVSLFRPAEIDMLVGAVELVGKFDMIVIDTLARSSTGADENSASDAGVIINSLDRLRRVAGEAAMVVIHHTGKDVERGARGSSAYFAAVDAEITVTGRVTGMVTTKTTKMKDDEDGLVTQLKGRIVELDDGPGIGEPVTSIVLVQLEAEEVAVLEGDYEAIDATTPAGEYDRVVAFLRNQGQQYTKNALLGLMREHRMGIRSTRLLEILELGIKRSDIVREKHGRYDHFGASPTVDE